MTWRTFFLPKPRIFIARVAVLVGLLPVVGWVGGAFWFFDLFNHFQVQYALFLLLCVIVLLAMKAFREMALAAACLLVPLTRIVPSHFPPEKPAGAGAPVRVVSLNVFVSNHRHGDTLRWVRETNPDFVYFTETTETWSEALEDLRDTYPHFIDEGTGFAFYSKLPIASHSIVKCSEIEFPLLIARIPVPNGTVAFFGIHPLPPVTQRWSKALDETMAIMALEISRESGPVILAGDFNATRWSHKMRPLHQIGLLDSAKGKAPGATWMRHNPLLSIPIDQVLYRGPGVTCRSFEIGPDLGSDHRPVVAEIAW